MRDFIIATESNADLTQEYIEQNNILVIPHYYNVEENMYGGDVNITTQEFYQEMRNGKKVGTAASNPAVILDSFTEIAKEGKDILFLSFTSALSCGYQNICNGASEVMEDYPDCKITVIDTLAASLGEAILIQSALNMKAEGKSMDEVAEEIKALIPKINTLFTVDDLEYLYRGGRLSKTSAVIGNVINLKPILNINEEGSLVPFAKVRGRKKAFATMIEKMEATIGDYIDKQIFVGIVHCDEESAANTLKQMIEDKFGIKDFVIAQIGPSIGAHTGPGTVGVIYLGSNR